MQCKVKQSRHVHIIIAKGEMQFLCMILMKQTVDALKDLKLCSTQVANVAIGDHQPDCNLTFDPMKLVNGA